jgi:predicted dehydrogenase
MAIRTLVVGLGGRGLHWAREVAADPAFELAGIVEVDAERRVEATRALRLAAEQSKTRLGDALADLGVAAVVIATPPDDHVASAVAALEAGCAVMVEKPFAPTLADAARVVALARRRNRTLMVAQNYRYMRAFRTARRLVADGLLGKVGFVQCQYFRPRHDMPAWLRKSEDSILWGAAVHHLDAVRCIVGDRITGVAGERFRMPGATLPPGGSMRLWLTFAAGARASYTGTYESAGHEFFEGGQEFYLRLVGEHGTLHMLHRWLIWCARRRLPRVIRRGRRPVSEERVLLSHLGRAMRTGEEPDASGRDNLQTMAILEAFRRAAASGGWVDPQQLIDEAGEGSTT